MARLLHTVEPVRLRWRRGSVSLGYLGNLRWRVRTNTSSTTHANLGEAIEVALAVLFHGIEAGTEASVTSPIEFLIKRRRYKFIATDKYVNGWRCEERLSTQDIGPHAQLVHFLFYHIASTADEIWARGVVPIAPTPLRLQFSHQAWRDAKDPQQFCRELAAALTERINAHPSPETAFDKAMSELASAGHALSCLSAGESWYRDDITIERYFDYEGHQDNSVGVFPTER